MFKLKWRGLDSGSQSCFLTTDFASLMKNKKEKLNVSVSGLNERITEINMRNLLTISNKKQGFTQPLKFLVVPIITSITPAG